MDHKKVAIILTGVISLITLFHVLIILKVIPYQITWGGRLHNDQEMYVFETVSILINLFFGWVVMMKGQLVQFSFREKILNIILWAFLVLFVLNTVGNLFAETLFEKLLSMVTLAFAVLIYRLMRGQSYTV